jgi:hypothetical protein
MQIRPLQSPVGFCNHLLIHFLPFTRSSLGYKNGVVLYCTRVRQHLSVPSSGEIGKADEIKMTEASEMVSFYRPPSSR